MLTQPKNYLCPGHHLLREKGMALLGIVFLLGMATTAYVLYSLNASELKIEREKITTQALSEAKSALIAWAVSNPSQPGMLPYPDRNNDGIYDGKSDCHTTTLDGNYDKLLGRLPWQSADNGSCVNSNFISGMGSDIKDGSGTSLWYAVSRNLVYPYVDNTFPVINPGMINSPNTATAPYQRNGGTTAYPWLRVFDKKGQLVSDRVAAILIAPGAAIGNQDRSAATPDAAQYLDTFTLTAGGGAKSNRTYAFPDEDFYMGEDAQNISSTDATYVRPYEFNDKLVYVTIDELMAAVEKRAAAEAKTALNNYFAVSDPTPANRFYPFAAPLLLNQTYHCKSAQLEGLLPINTSGSIASCSCSSSTSCSCPFNLISSVSFRRSGTATWSVANVSGACSRSPNSQTCTCTGAGFCKNTSGSRNFTCDAVGNCTHNTTGTYTFNGVFTSTTVNTQAGSCSLSLCGNTPSPISAAPPAVTCTGTGSFSYVSCGNPAFNSAATNSLLPGWFTANKWQDYLYYVVSSNCVSGGANCSSAMPQLTVGSRTGVQALLISTGSPVIAPFPFASKGSAQSRPSCNVNDYLDSAANTNLDTIFDKTSMPHGNSYNDQAIIVAP